MSLRAMKQEDGFEFFPLVSGLKKSIFYYFFSYPQAPIKGTFDEESLVKVLSEIERKNRSYTCLKFDILPSCSPLSPFYYTQDHKIRIIKIEA